MQCTFVTPWWSEALTVRSKHYFPQIPAQNQMERNIPRRRIPFHFFSFRQARTYKEYKRGGGGLPLTKHSFVERQGHNSSHENSDG